MTKIDWPTLIASVLTSGFTSWGVVQLFSRYWTERWLAKHRANLEKDFEEYRDKLEQKRKRLEAELGHVVYVTQTQFDTEFNAVKDVFAQLGKVRLSFNGLRPELSYGAERDEKLKELGMRLNEFTDRFNDLVGIAQSLYPFIPEEIYQPIEQCMKRAGIEILHIKTAGEKTFSLEWFSDGAKQREIFDDNYFGAVKLAREHFKRMTVVLLRQ